MHSDPEERLSGTEKRHRPYWILIAAATFILVISYLLFTGNTPDPVQATRPSAISTKPPPAELALPPAPDIPIPERAPEPPEEEATADVEITLEDSDKELQVMLADASNSELFKRALSSEDLVARCAGVVDGISRGRVPYKALPLKPPTEKFSVIKIENQHFIDPASYHRYDIYAAAIAGLNVEPLVSVFNRFRPLMEQAYAGLGYKEEEFDNALIRSLDRVLATPDLHEPIAVKRKEAIYLHADSQLEALTDVQKLLLRMGPDNVALIKSKASELRTGLLGSEPH